MNCQIDKFGMILPDGAGQRPEWQVDAEVADVPAGLAEDQFAEQARELVRVPLRGASQRQGCAPRRQARRPLDQLRSAEATICDA